MRTNLMKKREGSVLEQNTYYTVEEAFTVYALVGHSESNTYYGASMIYGNVYRRLLLHPGDEVHALHGGVFAVQPGIAGGDGPTVLPVRFTLSDKHPFEKTYGGEQERWPLDRLRDTDTPTRLASYAHTLPRITAGLVRIGRGIDTLTYDVPALAFAVGEGTLTDVSNEHEIAFAPSEGDGVTAEIFRLWDTGRPGGYSRTSRYPHGGRFFVTDAGHDFRVLFSTDDDVAEAIRVLHVAQARTRRRVVCADCGEDITDRQVGPSHECPQQRAANRRAARKGGRA